ESPWAAWSVGAGFRLLSLGRADLGIEARYLHLGRPADALVLGLRLAARFGGRSPSPPMPREPPPAPPEPTPSDSAPPLSAHRPSARPPVRPSAVVQTAVEVMGSPYLWGGSGANGFDCSGLIQYAYGRHGVLLPRRSQDQAKAGLLVPRDLADLLPGDILTFSATPGGPVTHVGLYLGDRRFIHSASDGVRLSLLSPEDPNGRHWWARWVGARRILVL
ncbi:MAG TPA: C40 family peptidase, partial [Gemmatimonadales bacterium]